MGQRKFSAASTLFAANVIRKTQVGLLIAAALASLLIACAGVPPGTAKLQAPAPPSQSAPPPSAPSAAPPINPPTAPAASPAVPPADLLYLVLRGGTSINTYSVDPTTGVAAQVGNMVALPAPIANLQPSADDRFLYADSPGSFVSPSGITVLATDASGVPQVPPIQTVPAPNESEFIVHPSGRFLYMSEGIRVDNDISHQDKLELYTVDSATGKLDENARLQASFPPSPWFSETTYKISRDGGVLYDLQTLNGPHATDGMWFRRNSVNPMTGELTVPPLLFWGDSTYPDSDASAAYALGDERIVSLHLSGITDFFSHIDVFSNTVDPQLLIHCTGEMLHLCVTSADIKLDRTEQFVLAADPATSRLRVLRIDVAHQQLTDTGNSISFDNARSNTPRLMFNQTGTLLYAVTGFDFVVHIFQFDSTTGAVSEAGSIKVGEPFNWYAARRK